MMAVAAVYLAAPRPHHCLNALSEATSWDQPMIANLSIPRWVINDSQPLRSEVGGWVIIKWVFPT